MKSICILHLLELQHLSQIQSQRILMSPPPLNKTLHHRTQPTPHCLLRMVSQHQAAMVAIECQMDRGAYIQNFDLHF